MNLWKRNAVIVAIVLFVGAAVYLNWSYNKSQAADGAADAEQSPKILGQASLVNGEDKGANASSKPQDSKTQDGKAQDDKDQNAGTKTADEGASGEANGYFSTARLNRQQARDSALELLQQAAQDEKAEQAMIDEANASIQTMAALTLSEAQVENLVTAKGYADCVCFINEDSASVVVSSLADGLTETDIARISEIVKEETGLNVSQIKIIEADP